MHMYIYNNHSRIVSSRIVLHRKII